MEQEKHYAEIDLRQIFYILKKRLWIILLITILATTAAGIISFKFITPIYEASAEILINKSQADGMTQYNQGDIQTNLSLMNTYSVMIKSKRILNKVIEDYNLDMTYQQLDGKIAVNAVKNSQIMSITVNDPSYLQAVYLANAVAQTSQKEIVKLMKIDNVHIMAEAEGAVSTPIKPKPYLNMAIAFVVGLMASVGLVFLIEYLDTSVRTEEDVKNILSLPLLGSLAVVKTKKGKGLFKKKVANVKERPLITLEDNRAPNSEMFRTIRTNLKFAGISKSLKTLMVTSTTPGEGKTTVSSNLAIVLAQAGNRVLLVDADMRRPTVQHTFRVSNMRGLTTALAGDLTIEEVAQETRQAGLFVVPSGPIPPNPAELLASQAMSNFIEGASELYDYVVFDTPPSYAIADAQILASQLDGVIMVVESGRTDKDMALKTKSLLTNVQANLLGIVLNKRKKETTQYYYYYGATEESAVEA